MPLKITLNYKKKLKNKQKRKNRFPRHDFSVNVFELGLSRG